MGSSLKVKIVLSFLKPLTFYCPNIGNDRSSAEVMSQVYDVESRIRRKQELLERETGQSGV